MKTVLCLTGALVLGAIAWGMYDQLLRAIQRNLFTGNPGIITAPMWPSHLASLSARHFAPGAIWCGSAGRIVGALSRRRPA